MKFPYSNTNKRYHSLTYANQQKYQAKVAKLCLDAGYSCINRDGIKGHLGCSFCPGSISDPTSSTSSLTQQIANQQAIIQKKWPQAKYQLYWQSFSNTYAPYSYNQNNYLLYKTINDVVGMAVATRVDCLSDRTLDLLAQISDDIDVTIELGLQTIHDSTRDKLNCGYSLAEFVRCVDRINQTPCSIVVHIINGLPGEDEKMMVETARFLNTLAIDGIKIHMLYIDSRTPLAQEYLQTQFPLLSREEYCDITISQLRCLNPKIVIHRLTGDGLKEYLLAPKWTTNKTAVLNLIDKKMQERLVYQGDDL